MPATVAPPSRRGLSRAALARLAAGAATFRERLGGACVPDPAADPAAAAARLERWRDLVARGDAERFARRLSWDGLDEAAALRGVGEVRLASGAPLPAWTSVAREAAAAAWRAEAAGARGPRLAAADARLPGRAAVLPFVAVARRRLRRAAGRRLAVLAPRARAGFEAALLATLADHAERAVGALFGAAAAARALTGEETEALLVRYPVLARILSEDVLRWTAATAELLARLEADRAALAAAFGPGAGERVTEVRAGLSDPHHDGRTVAILAFEGGGRVVYKPRPLAPERAFRELAAWLDSVAGGPALRPLRVLERGAYGWTAFAAQADCADAAAVERYHERAGKLLCLAYLLGAEDLHDENVVACGEHPVAIDLEVLLRAAVRDEGLGSGGAAPYWAGARHTVLSPGLLPRLHVRADGTTFPGGGFVATRGGGANVPTVGAAAAAADPTPALERGFRRAAAAIAANREALLAPGGALDALSEVRGRVLLRNTAVYGSLLQRTLTPRFLESGAERSIELDVLARPALRLGELHRLWPALRDEARQLERMDVPAFHLAAGETTLRTASGDVEGFAVEPGLTRAERMLRALDAAEAERQARCIRAAYASHRLRAGWTARHAAAAALPGAAGAVAEAREAARWLDELAVPGADGAPSWIALGSGSVEDAGEGLAAGRAGIGLFRAALAAVSGDVGDRAAALRTLAPVVAAARDPERRAALADAVGIGGAAGMGGVAWALLRAGELLEEPSLHAAAMDAAVAISPGAIAEDAALDVFAGSAGALLALMALPGAGGGAAPLDRARACGDRLLAARREDPATGLRAWPRADGGALGTGFGHGAAGIALALLRLHAATGEDAYRAAADEGFAFERALAAPGGGWLDHDGERTAPPAAPPLCGWCHGAAGIGLARAALPAAAADPRLRADLARAVAEAEAAPETGPATLCCGAMGRAELLLLAAAPLERPELADRARALARATAARAARRGTYAVGTLDGAFTPGLFQGIAGIGYQLLRVHHPERVPPVLTWG